MKVHPSITPERVEEAVFDYQTDLGEPANDNRAGRKPRHIA